jgi:hypothetical protein
VTAPNGGLTDLADLAEMEGYAVLDAADNFLARFIAYPNDHARQHIPSGSPIPGGWTNGTPHHDSHSCHPKRAAARHAHSK